MGVGGQKNLIRKDKKLHIDVKGLFETSEIWDSMVVYLYETSQDIACVFSWFVVDLGGEFDDLAWSVSSQVAVSSQHHGPRLHQEVVELLSCYSATGLLPEHVIRQQDCDSD